MGSWCHRSEEALATLVAERLGERARRVLIGGLGLGFTLRAAQAALPEDTEIVVAELVPKVAAWAEGVLAPYFRDALADPRVTLLVRDVHDVIVGNIAHYDAILLDVDNGPEGLICPANDRLYCNWGLRTLRAALRPGGVLAIWSSYPDAPFVERLAATGFEIETATIHASERDAKQPHLIWIASRSGR